MKTDLMEDFKDSQEIRNQKNEQKRNNEKMAKWESGKGLVQNKDNKADV